MANAKVWVGSSPDCWLNLIYGFHVVPGSVGYLSFPGETGPITGAAVYGKERPEHDI